MEHLARGDERFDAGDYEAAILAYTACLEFDAGCSIARANRGVAHGRCGRYAEMHVDLTDTLRESPDYGFALMSRGSARLRLGDPGGAEADLDRALALEPSRQRARYLRARARVWRGDALGAIEDIRRALLPPQEHVNARRAHGVRARAHLLLGEPRLAFADLEAARTAPTTWAPEADESSGPRFRASLRVIALALGDDLARAEAELAVLEREEGADVQPTVWRKLLGFPMVDAWPPPQVQGWDADLALWATGRLDDAAFVARAGDRAPETHAFIGIAAERAGDLERAFDCYRRAVGPGAGETVSRLWASARLAQQARRGR